MRLIYHPGAESEMIEAACFYDQQVRGLGTEFLVVIDRAICQIQTDPKRWQVAVGNVRRYLVPRFPYAVFYQLLPDHVYVLAIKHHSRHPRYWQHRLSAQADEDEL